MKFSISVSQARRVISLVKDVVPSRSVSQEAAGVLMEATLDGAIFTAVGSDTVVRVFAPLISVDEEGRAVVNASMFSNIVGTFTPPDENNVGSESLQISSNVKSRSLSLVSKTVYKNGNSVNHKRTVPLLNSELFPIIPKYDSEKSFPFPGIIFRDAVDKTHYAVSTDIGSGVLGGILMRIVDGRFYCVSTNGIKLAEYSSRLPQGLAPETEMVLPVRFAVKASRAIDPLSDVKMLLTSNMLWISSPGVLIGGVVINGKYPDYQSLLTPPTVEAVVDKQVLLDNVRNIDYGELSDNRISLRFKGGKLQVCTELAENDLIDVNFTGEASLDFDIKMLRSSIQIVDSSTLKIMFSEEYRPVYFSSGGPPEDPFFRSVLVPLVR